MAEHEPSPENGFTWRKPPWMKLEQGEPLTWQERIEVLIVRPLVIFRWRARITPALRERCVEYVVRMGGNSGDAWGVKRSAQTLAEYIAKGEN